MARRAKILALTGLLVGSLAGCSEFHYPVNERLYHELPPEMGYRFENLRSSVANTNSLVVCVSFSGGGARAGAMAYGVVRALSETQLDGGNRSLLDEVDVISAASGGSFPAAYLAAFGHRKFLNEFREQVLFRDLGMATFWRAALCPYNLVRICSPWFNRSDLAEEVYEGIFGTKTYADLHRQGRPFVVLNATDMIKGTRFEFTQDQFDGLRSSLGRVSLTRAVASSSAFPILLTPVAFRDNTEEDPESERYVHLIDGGIVDNLGLGHVLQSYRQGAIRRLIRAGEVGTLVFVVVNARNRPLDEVSESPQAPGTISVLSYGLGAAIDRQTDAQFALLADLVREESSRPDAPRVHLIEVDLEDLRNPARRARLLSVETTFGLDEEIVDELADASSQLLRENPSFVELLDVLR